MERIADGRSRVWPKDSSSWHTSENCQNWLSEYFYGFAFPDFYSLNLITFVEYYVTGAVEKIAARSLYHGHKTPPRLGTWPLI